MTKNNKGDLFVFEVGPSVKFVSAIKDAIFNKKMGVIFLLLKKCQTGGVGGGSEGGLAKDQTFSGFSFVQPSLTRDVLILTLATILFSMDSQSPSQLLSPHIYYITTLSLNSYKSYS